MGQSLSQIYVHLVFGTKERQPSINLKWETKLHSYISGILKKLESPAISINSVSDHVHVLFRLSKNYAIAKVVEELKKCTSKWVKDNMESCSKFSWQGGYGAFSVSSSNVNVVKQYIANQKMHHRKVSYQKEVEELIRLSCTYY